ncbi:arylesterase [Lysobacter sp. K5869]|uniref:arylesterase n=1 Tax=Lysobacter sp. K5869 TaxID=2820808 RepID=UPI001C0640F1|nr:arylesterase [Lysobacter sp. K5869]QWP77008.1 arylesterase [Lysobacter sp. K5869]
MIFKSSQVAKQGYAGSRRRLQWAISPALLAAALLLAALPAAAAAPAQAAKPAPAAPAPKAQRTVLFMGDSLSAGYGLAAPQGWVALTAQRIAQTKPGWRAVNASISGETTAGGAARIAGELQRNQPAVVAIELGANDGLRGLPLAQSRANLERMIQAAQAAKAQVLLIGMRMPPNLGREYTEGFERNYRELAQKYSTQLLPFLLEPVAADRSLFQNDNLHPTAQAQPKLRDHVWSKLGPMLK